MAEKFLCKIPWVKANGTDFERVPKIKKRWSKLGIFEQLLEVYAIVCVKLWRKFNGYDF